MPGDHVGSGDEVLAALVASLRAELAESRAALARAAVELAQARERIGELERRQVFGLIGLWPNLRPGCRMYTDEARNLELISLYFDQAWWRQNLGENAPGFVGSGVGLPLGLHSAWGSELGYAQKPGAVPGRAPDEDPEVLEHALLDSEKAAFARLRADRLASGG